MMKRRQQGILTGMPFMANVVPRTFVDDAGRKLYLAQAPSRLVSLAPSVTEMLFAIGEDERIVGVTDYCDYPERAKAKPKVGQAVPSLEAIVGLRPDLVLAPQDFLRPEFLAQLEGLKIPTFLLGARTIDDIPSQVQTLGRILDRVGPANAVAMELRRRISEVRRKTASLPKVRVLYVLSPQPLLTVGPGSFIHELIELAGGHNIAARSSVAYPRLDMETVLAEDPEVLLFPVGQTEGISKTVQDGWRRWTTLSAVKQGRLHQIPADLLNRPGPRIVDGLESLARALHPTAVSEPSS
jgi:iron complex transport system substrate-binding protein